MAAREENTDFTQCPVCFEPYTETGDYIPRILPCHCALCQSCILKLIQNKQLECPQDRTKHPARQEEKSFPQNKYILSFLRKEFQPKETDYDICTEHKMKLVLFCKNEKCEKAICPVCMSENHLTHQVVNVLEEEKKKLNAELEPLLETLNSYTEELQRAEIQVEKKYENLLKKLQDTKVEILTELKEKLSNVADNMATLLDMKDKIEKGSTHQELRDKLEFMNVMKDLCAEAKQPVEVQFYELTKCKLEVEEAAEEESEEAELEGKETVVSEENVYKKKRGPVYITHAKRICEVKCFYTQEMEVLSDGSVVLCGHSDVGIFSMIRYDRDTGEVLYRRPLGNWAHGMVEVNLGGKPALAVSYLATNQKSPEYPVKFFDVPHLYKFITELREDNVAMEKMCRRSDSFIIGHDMHYGNNIKLINCAEQAPKHEGHFSLKTTRRINDMCVCTDLGGKEILVIVYGSLGASLMETNKSNGLGDSLYARNFDGEVVWSIDGALSGDEPIHCISVTCDQRRHLFVCDDRNYCIECFSTDGVHLGCLVSDNEHGIGIPERIKYCRKTSSLLVLHSMPGEGKFLSELKIDYNQES